MFKKVYVVLLVAVLTAGYAQAQFTFGVRAGFNLSNVYGSDVKDSDDSPKMKPGIQLGVVGELAITDAFAIQPGILFAQQGWKYKEGSAYDKYTLNYIQIPVNAQYKIDLGGAGLLLQAGPYLGIGLGGKNKWKDDDESDDVKIKFGDDDKDSEDIYLSNRMDFGLGIGAGVQFSNFQVGLGYKFGFTQLDENMKAKNNGLSLTLTYMFGK